MGLAWSDELHIFVDEEHNVYADASRKETFGASNRSQTVS